MKHARWQLALRAHREQHPGRRDRGHARLMFLACSESAASAELVAAFPTAYVLQHFVQDPRDLDGAARATLEHGTLGHGVRHIVVLGHVGCRGDGETPTVESSQALVVARCRALSDDAHVGPMLRRERVTMRALWFDESSQDVYRCDLAGRPATLMAESELGAMFDDFDELSA